MSVSAKGGHECVSNCVFKLLENTHKNFMPLMTLHIKLFYPFTRRMKGYYGGSHELYMR